MEFNRSTRSRRRNSQDRIFLLLIIVFISLFFVDRYIGLDGLVNRLIPSETLEPTQTATPPLVFATAEQYVFAEPTQVMPTSTPMPTPTATPQPYFPVEYIKISDERDVERSQPLNVIGVCEEPYKSTRYTMYDPQTDHYRGLTDSIPYLTEPKDALTLALYDGFPQRNFPPDLMDEFPFPQAWRDDLQYRVLAISTNAEALVVHRWQSEGETLYWLSRGSDSAVPLMTLPNSIEESYTDPENQWLFLRYINDTGESDIIGVDLVTGGLTALTSFQNEDAFGGTLSWDQTSYAYWTREGIWVINLDGSFGALAFANAEQPSWSPDGERLVFIKDQRLTIGNLTTFDGGGGQSLDLPVEGRKPEWSPDGARILYWTPAGADCTLNYWDVGGGFSKEIFRTQNQVCQPQKPAQWTAEGKYVLLNLPATGDSGETSGDILCEFPSGQCRYLRAFAGNYPCREGVWSESTFPYAWNFGETAEGWYIIQYLDTLRVVDGAITTRSFGLTPVMNSPKNLNINADVYPFIEIVMRVDGGQSGEINFVTDEDPMLTPQRIFSFDVIPDGEYHRYVLDLQDFSWWDGTVKYLRFRPVNAGLVNIEIQSIRILPEIED